MCRCLEHPGFDPHDPTQDHVIKKSTCLVCRGLYYGAKYIGGYDGEFIAGKHDEEHAKIIIGPLSLYQFGHVRHKLHWNHYYGSGPTWHACQETMRIFLYDELSPSMIKFLWEDLRCKIHKKVVLEPTLLAPTIHMDSDTGVTLALPFNEETQIAFTVRKGMSVSELQAAANTLLAQTFRVPNNEHVLVEVK